MQHVDSLDFAGPQLLVCVLLFSELFVMITAINVCARHVCCISTLSIIHLFSVLFIFV